MPRRLDDDVARAGAAERLSGRAGATQHGRASSGQLAGRRPILLGAGLLLALGATLAVLLTDNPQLLRVAVVAVAWAFVLAAFAAGGRGTDRAAAAAREQQLRREYERELEREVAARQEYELLVENEVRRETEDAVRGELVALRGEVASLTGLRDEVAAVAAMRADLVALGALREEVARVAALRDDIVALSALRHELGQLGELRADMGRLRVELTEQLSSEMLIERIVMRTQGGRLPAESGRSLHPGSNWTDDSPPRELTGGWPAVRLDEPHTQQFEQIRVDRTMLRPPPVPPPVRWEAVRPTAAVEPAIPLSTYETPATYEAPGMYEAPATYEPPRVPAAPAAALSFLPMNEPVIEPQPQPEPEPAPRHSRHAAEEPVPPTAGFPLATPVVEPTPPAPLDWLAARSLLDPLPAAADSCPEASPRRRRSDDPDPLPPPVPPLSVPSLSTAGRQAVAGPTTTDRLAQIMAENGGQPSGDGRRRRRYREDGETDDVLARVLGRQP